MEAAVRVGRRWHRQVLASASREAAQSDHGDQRRRGASESETGIVPTARVCHSRELLITSALAVGRALHATGTLWQLRVSSRTESRKSACSSELERCEFKFKFAVTESPISAHWQSR